MVTLLRKPVRLILLWVGVWAALAFTATARADFITPDSIPQPPPTVGSAEFTPIYSPADLVTNQYIDRGLQFPAVPLGLGVQAGTTTAITNLGGVDVWAPAFYRQGSAWAAEIDNAAVRIQLVKSGTSTPAQAQSVTVEVLALPTFESLELDAFDSEGRTLGSTSTPSGPGSHGGVLLTLTDLDISSFGVFAQAHIDGLPSGGAPSDPSAWGVAGIEFTPSPATAPEPCSLALAAFGAMTFIGWAWRHRPIQAAQSL